MLCLQAFVFVIELRDRDGFVSDKGVKDLRRDSIENVAQNCKFKFFDLFRHYVSLFNF